MASQAELPPHGPDRAASHSGGKPPLPRQHPASAQGSVPAQGCAMAESVDDAEGLYVAVERCPLCSTSRRRLTCARCVRAGDFVYFDGRNTERYSEKRGQLRRLTDEKEKLQQRVIQAMDGRLQADKIKWKIMLCKIKIEQLREAVSWGNEEVRSCSCAPRRRPSGCSAGRCATRRSGTRPSATAGGWRSCWSAAPASCTAGCASSPPSAGSTYSSSPPTSSPCRRRNRAPEERRPRLKNRVRARVNTSAPARVPQRPRRRGGRVRPGPDVQHGERAGRGPPDHLPVRPLDLGRPERRDQHQHHGPPRGPAQQRGLLGLLQLDGGEEHHPGPRAGPHQPGPHHQRGAVLRHAAADHRLAHPGRQPAQEAVQQRVLRGEPQPLPLHPIPEQAQHQRAPPLLLPARRQRQAPPPPHPQEHHLSGRPRQRAPGQDRPVRGQRRPGGVHGVRGARGGGRRRGERGRGGQRRGDGPGHGLGDGAQPAILRHPLPAHGALPECTAGVPALGPLRRDDLLGRCLRHLLVQSLHRSALMTPDPGQTGTGSPRTFYRF
ncbi:beclin 1-associated autophagy-related key regulator isoform 1-T1 [Menidia menidia]